MIQQTFEDACASRHRGNENSRLANPSKRSKTLTQRHILEIIGATLETGATLKEISRAMHTTPNCISGRLTELKASGAVIVTGRRDKCGINYLKP